ncbi:putative F-box/LRR-repeat protein At4g15060 [Setaria viridis]|uniref:putative F-box/LRR-repeat protein At4g15060 n=1 Tax=Setaria viridis TaxID=4556 RepID=UPI003B3AF678
MATSRRAAMVMATRAKKRRLEEEEKQELVDDFISGLPDGILCDIVTLLPTRDGARTQVLSSRWRHIWRSAPLNLDLPEPLRRSPASDISRVLSAHPGPGRRFYVSYRRGLNHYSLDIDTMTLDGWLRSPAIDGLRELEILLDHYRCMAKLVSLPPSVLRFSTLAVASFESCVLPDCGATHWPHLKKLTLFSVTVSESSLHALLAGCSSIESLLLRDNRGFSRVKIVSPSLRSIGVSSIRGLDDDPRLRQLVIEDAPCLERLLFFYGLGIGISVISAPRLDILGKLKGVGHMLQFGTTALQGSPVASLTTVVPSVRVLALSHMKPCLDVVINLMKCFPHLENLHMKITHDGEENAWSHKYREPIDILLRKIVLAYFHDRKLHIEFAKFFVMNASVLESMTLELKHGSVGNDAWIRRQRRLLQDEEEDEDEEHLGCINNRLPEDAIGVIVSTISRSLIIDVKSWCLKCLSVKRGNWLWKIE